MSAKSELQTLRLRRYGFLGHPRIVVVQIVDNDEDKEQRFRPRLLAPALPGYDCAASDDSQRSYLAAGSAATSAKRVLAAATSLPSPW